MFFMVAPHAGRRQAGVKGEGRASLGGAGYGNLPVVLVDDDVVGDRQAESGPFAGAFCREKRVENMRPDLFGYARSVIRHHAIGLRVVRPGPDGDFSLFASLLRLDGVGAVHDQVEQHLVDLVDDAEYGRNLAQAGFEVGTEPVFTACHIQRIQHDPVDVRSCLLVKVPPVRKASHALDDLPDAVDTAL